MPFINSSDSRKKQKTAHDGKLEAVILQPSQSQDLSIGEQELDGQACYGRLNKIEVKNFMCHGHLMVNFGPNVNFLTGHNGSGKSAILTAIALALGSTASITTRASSVKSLIKEGASNAYISIEISNQGIDCFRNEVFGNKIVIERKISKDGSSSYKLKGFDNQTVSTRRELLEEMVDHYGIQIDNPLTILFQDTAKQFLSSSNSSEKYTFFMRGVQLDQLKHDYQNIEEELKAVNHRYIRQREILEDLKTKANRAKERFLETERIRDYHKEIEDMKDEMAWAQVQEKLSDLNKMQKQLQREEEKITKINSKISTTRENENRVSNRIANSSQEVVDLDNKIKIIRQNLGAVRLEIDSRKISLLPNAKRDKIELEELISINSSSLMDCKKNIDELKKKSFADWELESLKIKEQLKSHQSCIERKKKNLDIALESRKKLVDLIKADEQQVLQINKQIASLQGELDSYDLKLKDYERLDNDALSAFGQNIGLLLKEIGKNKGKFRYEVIGPIGNYISLKDSKWSSLLEKFFGQTLNNFLVQCIEDKRLLAGLMKSTKCRAGISIFVRDDFDYRSGEPDEKFQTILRLLDVQNPNVLRFLIVCHQIESTILVADRKLADNTMYQKPKNVKACYALDHSGQGGFKIGTTHGGSSTAPIELWKGLPRLTSKVRDEKQKLLALSEKLLIQRADLMNQKTRIIASIQQHQAQVERFNRDRQKLLEEIAALSSEGEILRERLVDPSDARIKWHELRLKELLNEEKVLAGQVSGLLGEIKRLEDLIAKDEAKCTSLNTSLLEYEEKLDSLKQDLDKLYSEQSNCAEVMSHWNKEVLKHQHLLSEKEALLYESQKIYKKALKLANDICEQVPVNHTVTFLDQQILKLTKILQNAQNQMGASLEEIAENMQKKCEAFETANNELLSMHKIVTLLEEILKERFEKWEQFKTLITIRTKSIFQFYLSQRGLSGRILIDHHNQTLEFDIKVNDTSMTKSSVRALSGGEKSYTTVCLLLAVWDAMNSPIRCLDEFDVFMDAINRSVSIELLIKSAMNNLNTQYLFITPQSMTRDASDRINIIRLESPNR